MNLQPSGEADNYFLGRIFNNTYPNFSQQKLSKEKLGPLRQELLGDSKLISKAVLL
ncbi:hypothetical protein HZA99_02530 [Candidatus Woesearchaeota archaeon]|nr:hypothetical protein [Candidatus Woesearchaeota archaeon]